MLWRALTATTTCTAAVQQPVRSDHYARGRNLSAMSVFSWTGLLLFLCLATGVLNDTVSVGTEESSTGASAQETPSSDATHPKAVHNLGTQTESHVTLQSNAPETDVYTETTTLEQQPEGNITTAHVTPPEETLPKGNATTPAKRSDAVIKPSTRRLMLVLRGNCSRENLMGDLERAFKKLSPVENITVTEIHCSTVLDVNVTLSAGELQLKQLLRSLSLTRNLPVVEDSVAHRFVLTDFSVREDFPSDGATSVRPRWVPTDEELIIYIAVGVLFGIVLVIAFVVCTIRCCRRQPTKTLDFLETPHLRLEDYSLTRIPRPHTIYADRTHFGQPFDTCIVPLEDAPRSNMRTFGASRIESRMSRSLSSSREKLASQHRSGPHGVDNPVFVSDSFYGRKAKG